MSPNLLGSHRDRLRRRRQQLAQHVLQDSAVRVVQRLLRRVDPDQGVKFDFGRPLRAHFHFATRGEAVDYVADATDLEDLFSRQLK